MQTLLAECKTYWPSVKRRS
uniref:Uncharacterized protein n=1 Tax=Anguilla anguilla TaxID=7936 RepID=A0A0E9QAE7_ANGAN